MKQLFLGVFVAGMAVIAASGSAVAADSPCKGLDNAACTKAEACGWVKTYKTKKGRVVNAFCRKKSTPKPKA